MRTSITAVLEEHHLKFLPLIWSGIWRKPGRSILIFLQVSVAFALFGVLQGMKTGVEQLIAQARADLLLVHGSLSLIEPSLPSSRRWASPIARCSSSFWPSPQSFAWQPRHSDWRSRSSRSRCLEIRA
jgi:hypothetical protein